jgi:formiminotetrahydrofolate cyclodeaminase
MEGAIFMFDINLRDLKEDLFKKAIVEHQQALNFCQEQVVKDSALSEEDKQVRLASLQNISNAVLALNVTVQLLEENNKALWHKLEELGVVQEN